MFHRVKSEEPSAEQKIVEEKTEKTAEEKLQNVSNDIQPPAEQDAPNLGDVVLDQDQDDAAPDETAETSTSSEKETEEMSDETETTQKDTKEEQGFSYRPTTAAPAAAQAGYPGSSPYASGGYGATSATPASDASSDRRLTIGAGITMSGEIESCDYLLVEGTVEAALKGANVLDIAESGVFYGTVEIGEANIAGRFEGDITVHGRLTISASGVVTGSIVYKELEIEAGAVIDGKLTPMAAVSASAATPSKKAPVKKTAKVKDMKAEDTQAPANTDGGLFSKAAAE